MLAITAFCCGLLFSFGLVISGMSNPAKVLGFLDITGHWDPSLAAVMAGALLVFAPGFYLLMKRREKPLLSSRFHWPEQRPVDRKLILGSCIFGIGWGLSGLCPGPAIANLFHLDDKLLAFIAAMLLGMALHRLLPSNKTSNNGEGC